jgi:hypothetical protein
VALNTIKETNKQNKKYINEIEGTVLSLLLYLISRFFSLTSRVGTADSSGAPEFTPSF